MTKIEQKDTDWMERVAGSEAWEIVQGAIEDTIGQDAYGCDEAGQAAIQYLTEAGWTLIPPASEPAKVDRFWWFGWYYRPREDERGTR